MEPSGTDVAFVVWGIDHAPYGPIELPTLVDWIKDERVTADTWVFSKAKEHWQKASQISELQMFFRSKGSAGATSGLRAGSGVSDKTASMVRPGALRRIKIFADFKEEDIQQFIQFMEVIRVAQWTQIVKQGDDGDAMFLVLEGELRVRLMISGKEKILTTLGVGEFFGEMSLFDLGPRSADVVANQDSLLLKISSDAFGNLTREAPKLASPFLLAIGKTLTARIRADNKRYSDSVNFAGASAR
jgi:hypothetical protein